MPSQSANIHDSFFKKVLGDPDSAGTFLREHLPTDVVNLLGPERPEPVESSFVDEELTQHQSDLLFRVHLRTGTDALAYVLMEHKSSPDPLARLQLLRYIMRILVSWYDQNKRLPLPPVLPVLAHHGPRGWKISREFSDLFGDLPAPIRQYLPSSGADRRQGSFRTGALASVSQSLKIRTAFGTTHANACSPG